MPIYEYSCEACGAQRDVFQKVSDPAPAKCDACGRDGGMKRQVSRTSFVLKGGGWYSDLYSSTSGKSSSSSDASPSSSSSSSSSGSSSGTSAAA